MPESLFWAGGQMWYMVHCHKCGQENWASTMATGKCAWCGYEDRTEKHCKTFDKVSGFEKSLLVKKRTSFHRTISNSALAANSTLGVLAQLFFVTVILRPEGCSDPIDELIRAT